MIDDMKDYANSGLTIRSALTDQAKRFPDKTKRPRFLLWDGLQIKTADSIDVSERGVVCAEFVSAKGSVEQGFDLDVDSGFQLKTGEWIHPIRTWNDPRYEESVQYEFRCMDGSLWVWNVYKMIYPGGRVVEEKWTENAGLWVEKVSETERVYHCSHGIANPPDFESLVFRVKVRSL